jgi:hypothetical protein
VLGGEISGGVRKLDNKTCITIEKFAINASS